MNASVAWDVNGCAYNQNSAEAQKFSVNGTVTLPDGVTNPDNLNLIVSVNVSVSRWTDRFRCFQEHNYRNQL